MVLAAAPGLAGLLAQARACCHVARTRAHTLATGTSTLSARGCAPPCSQGGAFELGDRVVSLMKEGVPPFGLHGTVIGEGHLLWLGL